MPHLEACRQWTTLRRLPALRLILWPTWESDSVGFDRGGWCERQVNPSKIASLEASYKLDDSLVVLIFMPYSSYEDGWLSEHETS